MSRPALRFAPSPNGRLHLGHASSALTNARVSERLGGRLLLRIEDIDLGRTRPEFVQGIFDDLAWLGLRFDGPVRRQSEHFAAYARARDALAARKLLYPCFCSRGRIAADVAECETVARDPDGAPLYPGTCRSLSRDEVATRIEAGEPHTWRLDSAAALAQVTAPLLIRRFAPDGSDDTVPADPARWGDAVIARRDVPTSYHLSVVWDDAEQGISHVVRGQDLEAATDLHVLLQRLLGLPSPAYHHHGLIRDETGGKLAKSKGSQSLADLRARGVDPHAVRTKLGFA